MAPKDKNERLELAKAISAVTIKQDGFMKAVECLNNLNSEVITNLDLEIETRKKSLQDLKDEMTKYQKDKQIEIDQFIAEYKYEAATKILKENKEVAIKKEKLDSLNKEIEDLKEEDEEEIADKLKEQKSTLEKGHHFAKTTLTLEHKAEIAQLNAQTQQKDKEIEILNKTIMNLQTEVGAQRELSKQIAEASARSAPINQSFGRGTS
jgi:hypothetical protein